MRIYCFNSVLLLLVISAPAEAGKRNRVQLRGKGGNAVRPGLRRKMNRKGGDEKKKARRQRKKEEKGGGKEKVKQRSECSRQTTTFCPAEKALALKMLYGQVANFFRQLKRAENHAKIVSKKKGKKDNFESDAAILQEAVGGSFSAPSCAS